MQGITHSRYYMHLPLEEAAGLFLKYNHLSGSQTYVKFHHNKPLGNGD